MGCLFASQLHRAGHRVTLLSRQASPPLTTRVSIELDGASHCLDLPASGAAERDIISHLLVTTKAGDLGAAVLSIAHRLDASSQVLLLANGLGYAAPLRARVPQPDYFFGTTTAGAYRIDDECRDQRHIRQAGRGLTRIGQVGRVTPPPWFEQWAAAVQPSIWDPDIEQALWLKLAINCAINPLTALHRCRNGELASPALAPRVTGLCEEIMRVSAAAGHAATTADLPHRVAEVIRATADNRSSMLQDVLAQRPTEIEYITGHLLRVAREHGIAAPQNEALFRSITDRAD